jgi:molybdopterin synthase catalytic subunit
MATKCTAASREIVRATRTTSHGTGAATRYDDSVLAPPDGRDWVGLTSLPLPVETANAWVTTPGSGAVVCFLGVVREDSEGRPGVTGLTYEAYEEEATRRLAEIAAELRRQWPDTERVALLHRVGDLALSEPSVAVVVSAPHRAEAFEAARFGIDTLKETVPIWKREHWEGSSEWAATASPARPVRPPSRTG